MADDARRQTNDHTEADPSAAGRGDIGAGAVPTPPAAAPTTPRRGPSGSLSDAASETGVEPEGRVPVDTVRSSEDAESGQADSQP